jgi:hypothetical protein
MEFQLTGRTWTVEVQIVPGEVPDVKKSYTDMTFRPEQVNLTFSETPGKEASCSRYTLVGPRVLKGGKLGQSVTDAEYGQPKDDWLQAIIADARMRCVGLDEGDS